MAISVWGGSGFFYFLWFLCIYGEWEDYVFFLLVSLQGQCIDRQMSTPSLYSSLTPPHGSVFYRQKRWEHAGPTTLVPVHWAAGRAHVWKGHESSLAVLPQSVVAEACPFPPWSILRNRVLQPQPLWDGPQGLASKNGVVGVKVGNCTMLQFHPGLSCSL